MFDQSLLNQCRELVEEHRDEIITLGQQLVRVASPSGNEGAVAELIVEAMEKLAYDEIQTDPAGNVIGIVRGDQGPTTILNGHMDVVDAGDPADWQYPPFGAEIHDGYMWGRGAADMKCALAAMIYGAALLKQGIREPHGTVIVTMVSLEEVGGWGTHLLLKENDLRADRAVVGEPTNNRILPGHRVRINLKARIKGPSMHASQANHQANPLFSLARFLDSLIEVTTSLREQVGYLTITPTITICSPAESSNITPSNIIQTLDVRADPEVGPETVVPELNNLLQRSLGQECTGGVDVSKQLMKTYTGVELKVDEFAPGYQLPMDEPWLKESRQKLSAVLGQDPFGQIARFTCDASRLYLAGIPTIMFGPGDIGVAHTVRERISIEQFLESAVSYMALAF